MDGSRLDRLSPLSGTAFLVLVIAGNALQGSTPALHGDADAVADFYGDKATSIAVGMSLSLVSLFFLAWFLGSLRQTLLAGEERDGPLTAVATAGGVAALALMAGGFALNAAGALRAQESGSIPAGVAVTFYDGGLALSGLAAPLAMAILLAATSAVVLRSRALPRWFGLSSAALAVLGLITPLSFILFFVFPLWTTAAGILLYRQSSRTP